MCFVGRRATANVVYDDDCLFDFECSSTSPAVPFGDGESGHACGEVGRGRVVDRALVHSLQTMSKRQKGNALRKWVDVIRTATALPSIECAADGPTPASYGDGRYCICACPQGTETSCCFMLTHQVMKSISSGKRPTIMAEQSHTVATLIETLFQLQSLANFYSRQFNRRFNCVMTTCLPNHYSITFENFTHT